MATALEMLNAHLKAMEELTVRRRYFMEMGPWSDRRSERIMVSIYPYDGAAPFSGSGSTFAVALKRAMMALQDEAAYMDEEDREEILRILDTNGVL